MADTTFKKDLQYFKFCLYGFLKNQRFFELYFLLILHYEKGLSLTLFGVLLSVRLILRAILEIPSGFIADGLGRRASLLFSYVCYMLSFLLYYFANSFAILIIPTILFSIGDAFRTGTHKAMIFEYLRLNGWQNQKVNYYGHTRAWSQTGSAISSLVATAIIWFRADYNIVFLYTLIPYTLGFILLASYPRNLEARTPGKISMAMLRKEISDITLASVKAYKSSSRLHLTFQVASLSGFYFAVKDYLQLIILAVALMLPVHMNFGLPADKKEKIMLGLVYMLLYFLTAGAAHFTQLLNSVFKSVYVYLNFLLFAGLLAGALTGFLHQQGVFTGALLLFAMIFILENLRKPAGIAVMAENFDNKILASVLSIESQLSSVIGALLSLLLGFLADRMGPGYAIMVTSLFMILIFLLLKIKFTPAKK
jgi:MFS family permease